MNIGVLALQGAFREHVQMLRGIGVGACEVRLPGELTECDGLIIPGGESTTIGKVARAYGLMEPLREYARAGRPVWGTCAGMILLASDIGRETPHLGLMDVKVQRNAFGRQVDSFEVDLAIAGTEALARVPFHAVFIRAPLIESVGPGVEVLARLPDGTIVAARQKNLLATSFHPELTRDGRVHEMFVEGVHAETSRRVDVTG
jgi:pyridoxal 5'-phosphate synthase pdxT subunit